MAHNDLNVVIGGGASLLPEESEAYLKGNGYGIFKNDIDGMRNYKRQQYWALFGDREMAYDIDRDPSQQPSLEEMTRKAIESYPKPNGFFLMVEGSRSTGLLTRTIRSAWPRICWLTVLAVLPSNLPVRMARLP